MFKRLAARQPFLPSDLRPKTLRNLIPVVRLVDKATQPVAVGLAAEENVFVEFVSMVLIVLEPMEEKRRRILVGARNDISDGGAGSILVFFIGGGGGNG